MVDAPGSTAMSASKYVLRTSMYSLRRAPMSASRDLPCETNPCGRPVSARAYALPQGLISRPATASGVYGGGTLSPTPRGWRSQSNSRFSNQSV